MKVPRSRYDARKVSTPGLPPDLVRTFYEAAFERGAWPRALQQLSELLGGDQVILYSVGTPVDSPEFFWGSNSIPIDTQADYLAYYWQHDPWHEALQTYPGEFHSGCVQLDYDVVDKEVFRRSVFRNEFLSTMDIAHCCGAVVNSNTIAGLPPVFFNCFRSERAEDFGDESALRLAAAIPHIQRALQWTYRFRGGAGERALLQSLVDACPSAMFVVDRHARIVMTNASAHRMTVPGDGIGPGRNGVLSTRSPTLALRLQALVTLAVAASSGEHPFQGEVLLVPSTQGGAPMGVEVAPLPVRTEYLGGPHEAVAVVTVHRQAEPGQADLHAALRLAFRLTPAECRVVDGILDGLSVREIAERLGVSAHSVHTQLKAVYQKTEVHRQSDLVRLVLSLPTLR